MVESRKQMALHDKAADYLLAGHPGADQFDRDPLAELLFAFGEIHFAHAAFTDQLQQPIGPNRPHG
jgi:hypothetical protein